MKSMQIQSTTIRRLAFTLLGVAATGTAVGAAKASTSIFAKQFLDKGVQMDIPKMVYDPVLQVMVDPVTKQPIYSKNNKQMKLAKVTAGCDDCPKYDE